MGFRGYGIKTIKSVKVPPQGWNGKRLLGNGEGSYFGRDVDYDGNRWVIGVSESDNASGDATGPGRVVVYDVSPKLQLSNRQEFTSSTVSFSPGDKGDSFGVSVSISNQRIAVGSRVVDEQLEQVGAVFIFDYDSESNTWTETYRIDIPSEDRSSAANFGYNLSLDGDRIAVFAPGVGFFTGAVYVHDFDGTDWLLTQKIQNSNAGTGALFGSALCLSGDRLFLNNKQHSTIASNGGAIYYYEYTGTAWTLAQEISPSDVQSADFFGTSVAFDGTRVVGANDKTSGDIYIWEFNGSSYTETQKINLGTRISGLSISGDLLIASNSFDSEKYYRQGAVYIIKLDPSIGTWSVAHKIIPQDAAPESRFGYNLAASNNIFATCAPFLNSNQGKSYLFKQFK